MKTFIILAFVLFSQISLAKVKELVVYTSRKEHLVKDIFKKYESLTGVKVQYKTGKAGALIQALKAEGSSSKADLFMTVDAGNLWYASSEGLLSSIDSKKLNTNVPSHLRDKNNQWFGLSVRARTIVYNTKNTKLGNLSTYEDLASPKWKGKICLRTSKKVYNQSLVAMLIDGHGYSKAKAIVQGWVKNNVEIFSNDTGVLKAVAAGQCHVGIVNTYYFGRLMKKDPKLPLKIFWPNQKTNGVHVNVSGAGIVKSSKHKKEAIKFLEWLSENEAQKSFAQVNMEYAINKKVSQAKEVKAWGPFKSNSEFHLTMAGKLQKEAIKLMKQVGYK
jgi:iron(III) transport system substrate-binding protein